MIYYCEPFFLFKFARKFKIMLRIIILTAILGLLIYLSSQIGLSHYVHPQKWIILAFFFAVSYLNHILLNLGFAKNRENFVQFYLGSVTARLILSLIFIGIFVYSGIPNPYIFIINFFVLYLCYTGFEIFDLYRKLRHFS